MSGTNKSRKFQFSLATLIFATSVVGVLFGGVISPYQSEQATLSKIPALSTGDSTTRFF